MPFAPSAAVLRQKSLSFLVSRFYRIPLILFYSLSWGSALVFLLSGATQAGTSASALRHCGTETASPFVQRTPAASRPLIYFLSYTCAVYTTQKLAVRQKPRRQSCFTEMSRSKRAKSGCYMS